jgi:hypothetical protein
LVWRIAKALPRITLEAKEKEISPWLLPRSGSSPAVPEVFIARINYLQAASKNVGVRKSGSACASRWQLPAA